MSTVIVKDREEVENIVAGVVRRVVEEHIPEAIQKANEPEWAQKEYVKERFGYSDRQLAYLRTRKRIRYSKRGRTIHYHIPSLKEYLEEGTVQPRNGPLAED